MKNKLLIAAVIVFILWRFTIIFIMWHDRSLPPEPDDSLSYIGHIYSVIRCPTLLFCDQRYISLHNQDGYNFLTYRLVWGSLAKIFQFDARAVYHVSFYLGVILLAFALAFFLRRITPGDTRLHAFLLIIMGLYFGGGGYHGFFWVVPSFFSVLLFFMLAACVLDHRRRSYLLLTILTPLFIYVHPISLFALAIFPLWAFMGWILKSQHYRQIFRRAIFVTLIAAIFFAPSWLYLHRHKPLSTYVKQTITGLSRPATPPSAPAAPTPPLTRFHKDYLDWLFPHPLAIIPFLFFIFLIHRYRHYTTLALYLACLVFTVTSSVLHPLGYRSLLFLWPITFLLYGLGFWCAFLYFTDKFKRGTARTVVLTLFSLALAFFVAINVTYSLLSADFINRKDNVQLNKDYTAYLLANTDHQDPIIPRSTLVQADMLNSELVTRPQMSKDGAVKYYVRQNILPQSQKLTPLDLFFAIGTTFFRGTNDKLFPVVVPPNFHPASPDPLDTDPRLRLEKTINNIDIYRDITYVRDSGQN